MDSPLSPPITCLLPAESKLNRFPDVRPWDCGHGNVEIQAKSVVLLWTTQPTDLLLPGAGQWFVSPAGSLQLSFWHALACLRAEAVRVPAPLSLGESSIPLGVPPPPYVTAFPVYTGGRIVGLALPQSYTGLSER